MRRAPLLLVLLISVYPAYAAGQVSFSGARSAALAGAASAVPGDARGDVNPASWGHVGRWSALLSGTQLYGLPELRYADAVILMPAGGGAFALGASTFGYELYRMESVEMGFARRIGVGTFREISAGLRVRSQRVQIPQYGRMAATGLSAGLHLPMTPYVALGAVVHNLAVRGPLRADVPRTLRIGAAYRAGPSFMFTVDVAKEIRAPASFASGVEISFVPSFVVRGGAASAPSRAAGGFGVRLRHLEADVAAIRHEVLGWTPSMSLCLIW